VIEKIPKDHPLDNVSIIKLTAYSPELNPIEQVWQWLRQNELANKCFNDYDDIVESCSNAWNSFISDIERVKNIYFGSVVEGCCR
jgi:transposase